jgi:hypothetical protein
MYYIVISNPIGGQTEYITEAPNRPVAEQDAAELCVHALDEVYLIEYMDNAKIERFLLQRTTEAV